MNILVIGAGRVGSAMAIDLANDHNVTCSDLSITALENLKLKQPSINTIRLVAGDANELSRTVSSFDLIVSAVPGFMGFETLQTIINTGKDVVDISFFPEDGLKLNDAAQSKDVTAIIDCGVAPGMDNLILGYHDTQMKIESFECLVGGLPMTKKWPFNYKAPFSPVDVIEEYTRPARYVEHYNMITKPALSDCELVEFEGVGTLESFNSDGLRSIIQTMKHIPHMKEKTLRYPGHAEYIKVLKESGFFASEKVDVAGQEISPLDFTCKILFKEWQLKEREEELTVMRVTVQGTNGQGQDEKIIYSLIDKFDPESGISSMARTTGYTATAVVNLIHDGHFNKKGVFPPELVGREAGCFDYILNYLSERNITYTKETVVG